MTQDEIEHMWKVASNDPSHDTNWHDPVVIAFAKLVAAKERETYMQLFLDPENQPTQFGTATQEYRTQEIQEIQSLLTEIANIVRTKHIYGLEMKKLLAKEEAIKELESQEPVGKLQEPTVERAWFTIAELNAWADKKLSENPHWVMPKDEPEHNEPPPQRTEQEPVAYLCENAVGHKYFRWKKPTSVYKPIALYAHPPQRTEQEIKDDGYCQVCDGASCTAKKGCVALSNPPQRKPLTDAQILANETLRYHFGLNGGAGPVSKKGRAVIDAIEAAHGIKE